MYFLITCKLFGSTPPERGSKAEPVTLSPYKNKPNTSSSKLSTIFAFLTLLEEWIGHLRLCFCCYFSLPSPASAPPLTRLQSPSSPTSLRRPFRSTTSRSVFRLSLFSTIAFVIFFLLFCNMLFIFLFRVAKEVGSCSYEVTVATSCSSPPFITGEIGVLFGDSHGNQVFFLSVIFICFHR